MSWVISSGVERVVDVEGVSAGLMPSISASTPATWGVAIEVPW